MPWVPGSLWKLYSPVGKKAEPRVTQPWVQILQDHGACGACLETSFVICKMWIMAVPTSCGAGGPEMMREDASRGLAHCGGQCQAAPSMVGGLLGLVPPLPTQNIV